jgi:hypothetical protein
MAKVSHPEWATKFRTKGTELRCIAGKYYLYEYKNAFDPIANKTKKISGKLIGRITEEFGLTLGDKAKLRLGINAALSPITQPENKVSSYIIENFNAILPKISKHFPEFFKEVFFLIYLRLIYQASIEDVHKLSIHSWLGKKLKIENFTKKYVAEVLQYMGTIVHKQNLQMVKQNAKKEYIVISTNGIKAMQDSITNNPFFFHKKAMYNLIYYFDTNTNEPTHYKLVKNSNEENFLPLNSHINIKSNNFIYIGSFNRNENKNITHLASMGVHYITSIDKSDSLLGYISFEEEDFIEHENVFIYEGNKLLFQEYKASAQSRIIIYFDKKLKEKEEAHFQSIQVKTSTPQNLETSLLYGITVLLTSDNHYDASKIFTLYKRYEQLKPQIDTFASILQKDNAYLFNPQIMEGWLFLNHLSLKKYHKIYNSIITKMGHMEHSAVEIMLILSNLKNALIHDETIGDGGKGDAHVLLNHLL